MYVATSQRWHHAGMIIFDLWSNNGTPHVLRCLAILHVVFCEVTRSPGTVTKRTVIPRGLQAVPLTQKIFRYLDPDSSGSISRKAPSIAKRLLRRRRPLGVAPVLVVAEKTDANWWNSMKYYKHPRIDVCRKHGKMNMISTGFMTAVDGCTCSNNNKDCLEWGKINAHFLGGDGLQPANNEVDCWAWVCLIGGYLLFPGWSAQKDVDMIHGCPICYSCREIQGSSNLCSSQPWFP